MILSEEVMPDMTRDSAKYLGEMLVKANLITADRLLEVIPK